MKIPRKREYRKAVQRRDGKKRERSEYAKMKGVITYSAEVH